QDDAYSSSVNMILGLARFHPSLGGRKFKISGNFRFCLERPSISWRPAFSLILDQDDEYSSLVYMIVLMSRFHPSLGGRKFKISGNFRFCLEQPSSCWRPAFSLILDQGDEYSSSVNIPSSNSRFHSSL